MREMREEWRRGWRRRIREEMEDEPTVYLWWKSTVLLFLPEIRGYKTTQIIPVILLKVTLPSHYVPTLQCL